MSQTLIEKAQEDLAFSIGVQLYILLFPAVAFRNIEYFYINKGRPANEMFYSRDPASKTFKSINVVAKDTLICNADPNLVIATAWLDLTNTFIMLSTPKSKGDMWWNVQLLDAYGGTFANVPGLNKKVYADKVNIIGPNKELVIKKNKTKHIIYSPTNTVFMIASVVINNGNVDQAFDFLDNIIIESCASCCPVNVDPIGPDVLNTLEFFKVGLSILHDNPLSSHKFYLNQLKLIGLDPNVPFDPKKLPPSIVTGLTKAVESGIAIIQSGYSAKIRSNHNWISYDPIGFYEKNDYLQRAIVTRNNIFANIEEEVFYSTVTLDDKNVILNGDNNYKIHFLNYLIPLMNLRWGSWSITLYQNNNFNDNPQKIYSVGTNTSVLTYNDDGSLDILIQQNKPIDKLVGNWLPVSSGPFTLVLRMYAPSNMQLGDNNNLPYVVLNQ
jgi:hypothetical protein